MNADEERDVVTEPGQNPDHKSGDFPGGDESVDNPASAAAQGDASVETPGGETPGPDLAAEYLDRLQRLQAEFNNYRKRQEKEKITLREIVTENNMVDILPVLDNLDRALAAAAHENATLDSLLQGVRMIHKQLENVLAGMDVRPMNALGQPFHPERHEAVSKAHSDEYEKDTVMQILQSGWMMGDKVIRHAVVVVSDGPPAREE